MNAKIHFLLNPDVVQLLAKTYEWSLKSKEEFDELPDKDRSEIRETRSGFSYIGAAVDLTNIQLEEQINYSGLESIGEEDLKRSYAIVNGDRPNDRLGLIYNWLMAKFPLLLPYEGNKCVEHLCDCNTEREVKLVLFNDFVRDMEHRGSLTSITRIPGGYLDAHTVEQLFLDVIEVVEEYNPEIKEIYQYNMVHDD